MYLYFFQVTGSMVAPHRAGRAGPVPGDTDGHRSDGCGVMAGLGPGPGCGPESRSGLGSGLLHHSRLLTGQGWNHGAGPWSS